MTRLIEVPTQFDDRSFDQFAAAYAQAGDGERLLFDAHSADWASPYGLDSGCVPKQPLSLSVTMFFTAWTIGWLVSGRSSATNCLN